MCWHKWGKWVTLQERQLIEVMVITPKGASPIQREDIIGKICEQERVCEKCGMKKLRIEKASV